MDLSNIISVAGKPGLYKILHQSRGGVIVTSLENGKKLAIGQTQRVSALSDISIYTLEGDMPLSEIVDRIIKQTEGKGIDVDLSDDRAVREFFAEAVPEHDEGRVYHSDIRKLIKWFNLLLSKGLLESPPAVDAADVSTIEAEIVAPEVAASDQEPTESDTTAPDSSNDKEAKQ